MKADIGMSFKNTCELELIDSRTNRIKQKVKVHNVVLNRFWTVIAGHLYDAALYEPTFALMQELQIGQGSGTPSPEDTALFSALWRVYDSSPNNFDIGYPTSRFRKTFIVPATENYVGNITELGLYKSSSGGGSANGIYTHALLSDTEDNPIVIEKTSFDILKITVTFYVIFNNIDTKGFQLTNPENNAILTCMKNLGPKGQMGIMLWGIISDYNTRLLSGNARINYLTVPKHFLKKCVINTPLGAEFNIDHYITGRTKLNGLVGKYTSIAATALSLASKKITITYPRLVKDEGNTHYYHAIEIPFLGMWTFPNTDIFPYQTLNDMDVAVGDGVTTHFKCPLNYFVKNTEVIKLDGVVLSQDDYIIDNESNPDFMTELTAANFAEYIASNDELVSTFNSAYPLFRHCGLNNIESSYTLDSLVLEGYSFKAGYPLLIDMQKEVKINRLILYKLLSSRGNTATFTDNLIFDLLYSDDGETYILATTIIGNCNTPGIDISFETITARYWKLECTNLESIYYLYQNVTAADKTMDKQCKLGYSNPLGLVFKNPPVSGAVIVMTAQIDRPFKNENFVFDTNIEFSFG